MEEPTPPRCTVEAWQPPVAGIAEVFHAHIVDWGYPPHCHDTWTVLIVDHGAIDYSLDRKRCAAVQETVAILPPGVIHDGQPASRARQGFWKRNLYLDVERLSLDFVGPAVDTTTIDDAALRVAISGLHDVLVGGPEPLDAEARLALICERLRRRLRPRGAPEPVVEAGIADRLRELLDEDAVSPLTLEQSSVELQRSVPHLVRSFTSTFGVSPHAYVIGRRVAAARPMLLAGRPPAEVATSVGFYDQAHLTRHFKRHTSTTPARYATSHRAVPAGGAGRAGAHGGVVAEA